MESKKKEINANQLLGKKGTELLGDITTTATTMVHSEPNKPNAANNTLT
jgi:hypothetical protein